MGGVNVGAFIIIAGTIFVGVEGFDIYLKHYSRR